MSTANTVTRPVSRRLELSQVLADLAADGVIIKEAAEQLARDRRFARSDVHPLTVIADQKWKDLRQPKKLLNLETLTQWLADKAGLPYLHIDPFKIDFAAVTKVMSSAYAERYKILPVAVNTREATIATAEPYVRDWEESLKQVLRLDIKRVIANPLDIQSYVVEFYNLARSVKGASEKDKGAYSEIANFEQLVQLGRSGKLDANDQHVVHICDWLFNYAFEQRASDIHLEPRRDVEQRALPHRRRAASGLPDPDAGDGGDDQPHQGARSHGRRREAPAAGRPVEDGHARRRGGGAAPFDDADRIRRKAGHAHLQSRKPGQGLQGAGILGGGRAQVEPHGPTSRTASYS